MATAHLKTSQTNALFEAVGAVGLQPDVFRWESRNGSWAGWPEEDTPALVHQPTGYFCAFALLPEDPYRVPHRIANSTGVGNHAIQFSPGTDEDREMRIGLTWPGVLASARSWLGELRTEVGSQDLWATILTEQRAIAALAGPDQENTVFSTLEQQRIRSALDEVQEQVRSSQALTTGQVQLVLTRLEEVQAATSRLGRKDWIVYVMGSLTSAAISAALAPDAARGLFHAVGAALAWLAQQTPMLP